MPELVELDRLIRSHLKDPDINNEDLYLIQVVRYDGPTSRGVHQDDLPNAGHVIVAYTGGHKNRYVELIDRHSSITHKATLEPGSLYVMKNSVRYGSRLPQAVYGHGKIEHNVSGTPAMALILRYGTPHPTDVPVPSPTPK